MTGFGVAICLGPCHPPGSPWSRYRERFTTLTDAAGEEARLLARPDRYRMVHLEEQPDCWPEVFWEQLEMENDID